MTRWSALLREPDRFDAVTDFLVQRGLIMPVRLLMAVIASSSALTPLSLLIRGGESVGPLMIVVGVVAGTLAAGMTVFWLTRWPTRRQSVVTALVGTVCVAGWSFAQSNAALAALACTAAAVTGGYLGFFHGIRPLALNVAVGLTASAVAAVRLAHDIDIATAVSAFWLMWLVNTAVPLAIYGTSKAMTQYAIRSDVDYLTDLLNRRGFYDAVLNRLVPSMPRRGHDVLAVVMIDIDGFKAVNDTLGHAAGDRILMGVADTLRRRAPADSAVCRAGGEEFLVAITANADVAREFAHDARDHIARGSAGITASVGFSSVRVVRAPAIVITERVVDDLVDAADRAMYAAKRDGGNRVAGAAA